MVGFVKRTKIVATIGPATKDTAVLCRMIRAGMDVARVNFSHGDHAEQKEKILSIRRAASLEKKHIGILQDLGGPKIRLGDFSTPTVELKNGQIFTITISPVLGDVSRAYINYSRFPKEVKKGFTVFLDDGKLRLSVEKVGLREVSCRVISGGVIKGKRGVSVPETRFSLSALTPKDKKDALFGVELDVDFVALSFVRDVKDIKDLRRLLHSRGSRASIVAKIETRQAVENLDEVINEADAVMVARGDLAVEISAEEVPLIQKKIINLCNKAGKPVITATQILESMIKSATPTRAEVSDIANAVLDGTDALMLSEETALGLFPLESVEVMARTAFKVEGDYLHNKLLRGRHRTDGVHDITDSVTAAAIGTAEAIKSRHIVALTMSGFTARMLCRHKPSQDIWAFCPSAAVCRKLSLSFGCKPFLIRRVSSITTVQTLAQKLLVKSNLARKGEKIIVVSGLPLGMSVETNTLFIFEL